MIGGRGSLSPSVFLVAVMLATAALAGCGNRPPIGGGAAAGGGAPASSGSGGQGGSGAGGSRVTGAGGGTVTGAGGSGGVPGPTCAADPMPDPSCSVMLAKVGAACTSDCCVSCGLGSL